MSQQKIALFGGSFDPIHQGHLSVASYAQKELGLDKVIFIPCAQSPHKLEHKYTANHHRLAMLQLAIQEIAWAQVSDYEFHAPKPSYSLETIKHFKGKYDDAEFYWILGADQWHNIQAWHEYEQVLQLVTMIVYPRESEDVDPAQEPKAETSEKLQNNMILDEIERDEKTVTEALPFVGRQTDLRASPLGEDKAQCIKDTREPRKLRISSILLKMEDLQRSQVNNSSLKQHPIYLDQASYLPISSTFIRKNFLLAKNHFPAKVFNYALTHQLYL